MSDRILVLLHTEEGDGLSKWSCECVGAAKSLVERGCAESMTVGLVGGRISDAASQLAGCGAAGVLGVEGEEFACGRYSTDAAAAEALIRASNATVVLAPGTSRWSRVLAGVSHRVSGVIDTHATGFEAEGGKLSVSRWYYRQRMVGKVTRSERPWIVTVDSGCFVAWTGEAGEAAVQNVAVTLDAEAVKTTVSGFQSPTSGEQTILPEADLLFVAGAGWGKKQSDGAVHVSDAEELIMGFLGKSKASLGSSKSLVDQAGAGQAVMTCLTHLNQVGQTGATPRHPRGLATCCHGEEPHVVGWRFINERRAVNLDANCGWAQGKADVLYVADAFEVMKKVNELMK